ncbi:aminoglycoside phosphotransferase family protein [Bacillus sp. 1P06AnD]|uniref:aminoglycoside phosphotransferase family protein n=1 Tax=Bacillus sp. 1P06AnD TaxID=3132208 RepID=UPI00399F328D
MYTALDVQSDYIRKTTSIRKLSKGFSFDEKYVIDEAYLLRIFPLEEYAKRAEEFETIGRLNVYSDFVPRALEMNVIENPQKGYMILEYLPGGDGEEALGYLQPDSQYEVGVDAGKELKKLHKLPAPDGFPSWHTAKTEKVGRYLAELRNMDVDQSLKDMLQSYISEHEGHMKDRPNTFQHDDITPSNLIIHNGKFAGFIDFQRMDWGDPIHDLQKIGFFSKPVSIELAKGIIDGYHGNEKIDASFWQLYTLYSAIHIVSALVWGLKMGKDQYELLYKNSLEVIKDHGGFTEIIPAWYK